MLNFIRKYDLSNIKIKFIALYIFNVIDIVFTLALIKTGLFQEANIIMKNIIDNQVLSIIIKVIFPLFILVFVYIRMQKASANQLFKSNIIISICLVFYLLIFISHIVYTFIYFSIQCFYN